MGGRRWQRLWLLLALGLPQGAVPNLKYTLQLKEDAWQRLYLRKQGLVEAQRLAQPAAPGA